MSKGGAGLLPAVRQKVEQSIVRNPVTRWVPVAAKAMDPRAIETVLRPSKAPKFGEVQTLRLPGVGKMNAHVIPGKPGEPHVVLIHGYTACADTNYGWFADSLHGTDAVALDVRGHGEGGLRAKDSYDPDTYLEKCASDVVAAMDELGIPDAIVVGYSMGTAIASLVAKNNPERVSGVLLCMGAPTFRVNNIERAALEVAHDALQRTPAFLRRTIVPFAELGLCKLNPYLNEFARNDPLAFATAGLALDRFDASKWFPGIECPIATVISDKDQLVPYADAKQLKQLNPAVEEFEIKTWAGHLAAAFPGEFPKAFRDALDNVIERSAVYRQGKGKGLLLGS